MLSLILLLVSAVAGALAKHEPGYDPSTPVVELIHRFSEDISLERIVVRESGELIVGLDNHPTLYQIDPVVNGSAKLIHTFDNLPVIDIHGIVEVERDQFYVAMGNLSLVTHVDVPGSGYVYHVNMSRFPDSPAEVHQVAHFPESRILNGLEVLDKKKGLIYVGDSRVGVVRLLNVYTGHHFVAINDSLTQALPGSTPTTNSVHGLHVLEVEFTKYLYFSNFGRGIIGRVQIHSDTGLPVKNAEVVVANLTQPEDFAFDKERNIFLAQFTANDVVRIDEKTKKVEVIAGSPNSTEFKWATAVKFGRRESDEGNLYVAINGGFLTSDFVGGAVFRLVRRVM